MKRGLLFALISMILFSTLISCVLISAYETTVSIEGKVYQSIVIRVKDPDLDSIVESVYATTDVRGHAVKNFTTNRPEVKLTVMTIANDDIEDSFDFGPFRTNKPINITLPGHPPDKYPIGNQQAPSGAVTNESAESNETTQTNETSETSATTQEHENQTATSGITGNVVSNDDKDSGENFLSGILNNTYYIVGVAVVVVLIVLVIIGKSIAKRDRMPKQIIVRKQSEIKQESTIEHSKQNSTTQVHELERQMQEIQKKILRAKNQDRINEIQRKIQEDQRQLDRLQRGDI